MVAVEGAKIIPEGETPELLGGGGKVAVDCSALATEAFLGRVGREV